MGKMEAGPTGQSKGDLAEKVLAGETIAQADH